MTDKENEAMSNDANSVPTLGDIFVSARKQQGLSEQQVADRLHLRLSSIQAIESDGIEKGVSLTFTKGYVRLYARLLGLNSEPLLAAFDKLHAQDTQPAKLQSFSKRVAREANDSRWNMVTYIIVFLVIGSVVVWWIDQSDFSFSNSFSSSVQSTDQDSSTISSGEVSSVIGKTENIATLDDSGDFDVFPAQQNAANMDNDVLSVDNSATDTTVIAELDTGLENATEQTQERLAGAGQSLETNVQELQRTNARATDGASNAIDAIEEALPAATRGLLSRSSDLPYAVNSDGSVDMVFTFSDDCWVSVKDAFDETIAIGVKVKGRVMEVSGIPPIQVILGAPQDVAIDFGGQSIDMSVFEAGRSANFQLPIEGE